LLATYLVSILFNPDPDFPIQIMKKLVFVRDQEHLTENAVRLGSILPIQINTTLNKNEFIEGHYS
jgi:hypothetical protein